MSSMYGTMYLYSLSLQLCCLGNGLIVGLLFELYNGRLSTQKNQGRDEVFTAYKGNTGLSLCFLVEFEVDAMLQCPLQQWPSRVSGLGGRA